MATILRWMVSTSASAFHAAQAIIQGRPLADSALANALAESAHELAAAIEATGIPSALFWEHAAALAAGVHNNRELAGVLLTKCIGRAKNQAALVDPLAAAITSLEHAYDAAAPRSNNELEVRSGPLREQWEARGPGMLAQIGRSTEPDLIVPEADLILVHPIQGGGGAAHLPYNSVRIEAVLTNPHFNLPEVVRLAWLLAQLNNDLPIHQDNLPRDRVAEMGAFALVPATLAAAETVELARSDQPTLAAALDVWQICKEDAEQLAATLDEWWQVYSESRPRWAVALAALDRMVANSAAQDTEGNEADE